MSNEFSANSACIDQPTVFFDGVCGLCNHTVNWLLAHDPEQGKTAGEMLDGEIRNRLDTLVFVRDGETFTRTAAVSRILITLGGRWHVLGGLLWIIPSPIRDLGYCVVSRLRYRLFGKHESCRLPSPQERAVFLD